MRRRALVWGRAVACVPYLEALGGEGRRLGREAVPLAAAAEVARNPDLPGEGLQARQVARGTPVGRGEEGVRLWGEGRVGQAEEG